MALYKYITEDPLGGGENNLYLSERNIYGSSRIGQEKIGEILASSNPNEVNINIATQNSIGDKFFEMSNHLGNVLEVVTDRKLPVPDDNGNIDYFLADVVSYSDYYPYGMQMPKRNGSTGEYRYGYNTQERVDEIAGKGNHYTAPYWEYDPRVVHRWNRDPKPVPSISPYAINQGNPIWFSDPLGDTIQVVNKDGDIEFQINEGKGLDIFKIEDNEKIKDLILVMNRRVLLEKDISNDDKNKAIIEEFGGVRIADKPRLSGRMDTGDSEYDLFFNLAYDYYFNEEKGEKPMKNVFIASEDFKRNYHAASLGEDLGKKDREKLNFYNQIKESTPKFIFQTGIILKVPTREDIKNQSRPINTQPYKP